MLGVEQQAVEHASGDGPAEPLRVKRAEVGVGGDEPHRSHRHVEAREVRVIEHAWHQRERQRGEEPCQATVRLPAEEVDGRDGEPGHQHAGEAVRRALFAENVEGVVEQPVREREERLHQHRVLVIDREVAIDLGALERDARILEQQSEPGVVAARSGELEALVARVAERPGAREQAGDVRRC